MANTTRKSKLESVLHREIATCVQQELRDPRLGFITVLRVELTPDLAIAKAYYTVLGDPKVRRLAEAALLQARGFVQSRYAKALATRSLPTLEWVYDDADFKRTEMDELIRKARATDSDLGAVPTPPAADPTGILPADPRPQPKAGPA